MSRVEKTSDMNDIFGGEYRKCVKGKMWSMDSNSFIYPKNHIRVFPKIDNTFKTNEEHLLPVKHFFHKNNAINTKKNNHHNMVD